MTRSPKAAPDAWTPKGVSINLSRSRRESLKAFADSSGTDMTPAKALYSLIDMAGQAGLDSAEAESVIDARLAESETLAVDCPCGARDQPNPIQADTEIRMANIEREIASLSESMERCAAALEQMVTAMGPLAALMSYPQAVPNALPEKANAAMKGLTLAKWIESAALAAAMPASRRFVVNLRLSERRRLAAGDAWLLFDCQAADHAAKGLSALPALILTDHEDGALALCLALDSDARLVAAVDRGDGGGWVVRVSRRAANGAVGPAIFRVMA